MLDDQVRALDREAIEEVTMASDDEGEVLNALVQWQWNTEVALKLLERLLRYQSVEPESITTDALALYGAARSC